MVGHISGIGFFDGDLLPSSYQRLWGIVPYFKPVFLTIFFFVSGYLTKSGKTFGAYFEQRTRTLFVPLLIFGLCLKMIFVVYNGIGIGDAIVEVIKGVFIQMPPHNTSWFVASLYLYSLTFYWIERWCKNEHVLLLVCIMLFLLNSL